MLHGNTVSGYNHQSKKYGGKKNNPMSSLPYTTDGYRPRKITPSMDLSAASPIAVSAVSILEFFFSAQCTPSKHRTYAYIASSLPSRSRRSISTYKVQCTRARPRAKQQLLQNMWFRWSNTLPAFRCASRARFCCFFRHALYALRRAARGCRGRSSFFLHKVIQ